MQLGKKNMSVWQRRRLYFRLMTILIQKQAKYHPNQRRNLIKHPHFQLNTILIMKKHPLKKAMLEHEHQKNKFLKQSKSYIWSVAMNTMNIYILTSRWLYLVQFKKLVKKFMKIYKFAYCTPLEFLLRKISTFGIPKSTVLVIIFRV